MNGNSTRHTNPSPIHEVEVAPKQWIENNFLNPCSPASTMSRGLNMNDRFVSYLRSPEQNHHAATKGYADTKLSGSVGDVQGDIRMGGNQRRRQGGLKGLKPPPLAIRLLMLIFFVFHQHCTISRDRDALQNVLWQSHRRSNTFVMKPSGYEFSRFEKY